MLPQSPRPVVTMKECIGCAILFKNVVYTTPHMVMTPGSSPRSVCCTRSVHSRRPGGSNTRSCDAWGKKYRHRQSQLSRGCLPHTGWAQERFSKVHQIAIRTDASAAKILNVNGAASLQDLAEWLWPHTSFADLPRFLLHGILLRPEVHLRNVGSRHWYAVGSNGGKRHAEDPDAGGTL